MTPLVLAVLGLVLAGPVPAWMTRATWLRRTPRSAMLLWQAVALAACLAGIGAGLALVTDQALGPGRSWPGYLVGAIALAVTVVVAARLALAGHVVGTRIRALRRRNRRLVDLLGEERSGVRVLEHETPMAYCLPGIGHTRVVVSAATYAALSPEEFDGVLAHERAHLRARHDLVLEAFTVLHQAFPSVVTGSRALGEVQLLVEILADDAARRRVGPVPVGRALVALAEARVPQAALGVGSTGLPERMDRLRDDRPHPVQSVAVSVVAVALVLVPTLTVALPWLSSLTS